MTTSPLSAAPAGAPRDLVPTLAIAALVGSILSLCVGTSIAKGLFPALGAEGVTALRVTLAALMLSAIFRPWRQKLTRADLARVLLFGVVLGAMNLLFYKALETVPLGVTIAIEFVGPLGVALASSRRALDLVWIALAAVGLGLLLPLTGGGASIDPTGVAYALAAGGCWAAYIVLGSRLGHLHGGRTVALAMTIAAAIALPFGLATAGTALFDPRLLMVAMVVAALSSALPYWLEIFSLKHIPKQSFGVLLSLEPAVGSLSALVILGERPSAVEWLAIGAIVAASAGAALGARKGKAGLAAVEPAAPL